MKIDFSINVVLYLAAISVGIYFSILLFTSNKNRPANRLLGLLMLAITGWITDAFFRASGLYSQYPNLYFLPIYYSFAFGPLLYFYVQAITNQSFIFRVKNLIHFIPVIIQGLFYWVITFQDYHTKYAIWFNIHQPYTYRLEYDGTWLSIVIYLLLSIRHFTRYRQWLNHNYSHITPKLLNWLRISLLILILVCITWLFEAYLRDFKNTYYQYDFSTNLLCGVIYCIGILGMQQSTVTLSFTEDKAAGEQKPAVADADIFNRIEQAVKQDKLYLNPELTLADLAKHLGMPAKIISANINAATGKPFNTYINTFRVAEIKVRLQSTDIEKFTLLGIAFESGFNSKTSFNRIFKEFTGQSPSQFVKK